MGYGQTVQIGGEDGEVLRLIFNMVPSNAYLEDFEGDVGTLPYAGQWSSLQVRAGMALAGSDVHALPLRDARGVSSAFPRGGSSWVMMGRGSYS